MISHEAGTEPPSPAEIRKLIIDLEESMDQDRANDHAGTPATLALQLMREGRLSSFAEFETWLRQTGSRVYFTAIPIDSLEPGWRDMVRLPFGAEGPAEYMLWISVNGDFEAHQLRADLGITPEENARRLLTAGLPTIDE